VGRGIRGDRWKGSLVSAGCDSGESSPTPGMILLRRKETHAAIKRDYGSLDLKQGKVAEDEGISDGRDVKIAHVGCGFQDEQKRFISILPLRLRMTGTIAINSLTLVIALQCCRNVREVSKD